MPEPTRRAARLAAGLCAACGVEPVVEGQTRCKACAEAAREAAAARRELARKRGLCEACMTAKRAKGKTRCDECAAKYLPAQLERDRAKRAAATG
jgi:hypothetical protein